MSINLNLNERPITDSYITNSRSSTNENITFHDNPCTILSGNALYRSYVASGDIVKNTNITFGSSSEKQDNQEGQQQPAERYCLGAPSIPRPNAKCLMCDESFITKLLCFVCCPDRILCLDCVKDRSLCPKCSKQLSKPKSQTTSSSSSLLPVTECRLCREQSQTQIFRFLCCDKISLCLGCVKKYPKLGQCPKCSKKQKQDNLPNS